MIPVRPLNRCKFYIESMELFKIDIINIIRFGGLTG